MSDTTNKPSVNSILPAATSAEAFSITSLVLGFHLLTTIHPELFILGTSPSEGFAESFIGIILIAVLSIALSVLALAKSAANWVRGAAGAGMLMSVLAVLFALLNKVFS